MYIFTMHRTQYAGDLRQTEQKIEQQKRTLTRLDEELKPVEVSG